MGVHDYTCFFHSINEGEQCIDSHDDCSYDRNDTMDPDQEYGDDTDDLYPDSITDDHNGSSACSEAYLLIFKFLKSNNCPLTENSRDEVCKRIKNGQYLFVEIVRDGYSWDAWGFDNISGYYTLLNPNIDPEIEDGPFHYSLWPLRRDLNFEVEDVHDSNEFLQWALTVCPACYRMLIENDFTQRICSQYLKEIAIKHEIEIVGITNKIEVVKTVERFFSGLIGLIEQTRLKSFRDLTHLDHYRY